MKKFNKFSDAIKFEAALVQIMKNQLAIMGALTSLIDQHGKTDNIVKNIIAAEVIKTGKLLGVNTDENENS